MRCLALAGLVTVTTSCQLLGFYDEPPTDCPEELACCFSGDPLAHGGCDWTCNDPAAPDFLLTSLRPTAGAPVAAAFRASIEDAVAHGGIGWMFDVRAADGSMTFRTGSAICSEPGACSFDGRLPIATGDANLGVGGRLSVPTSGTFDVTVRVESSDLGAGFDLPLHECTLTGPAESGANCIGSRRSATAGDWSTPGVIACEISANEATAVDLTALNLTLCDLLAGCGELGCCDDPDDWDHPPDDRVDGFPSWRLRADVAAIGVRVVE